MGLKCRVEILSTTKNIFKRRMGFDDAARDTRGQLLRRVGEKEKQKKRTWKERVRSSNRKQA